MCAPPSPIECCSLLCCTQAHFLAWRVPPRPPSLRKNTLAAKQHGWFTTFTIYLTQTQWGLLDVTPLCLISSYMPHLPLLSRTTHTSSTQPNYLQQGPPQGTRKSIHSDLSSTAQTDVACYSLDHLPSPLSTLHHQVASPLHDPERKQHWLRSASKLHTHIIVSPWLHCIQLCHLPCLYRPGVHFSTNDERASPAHPPPAMPSGRQHQADP